jgi:hypothetical protein
MELLSVVGKIASVGPRWRQRQDTIYGHLEIFEEAFGLRRIRFVRAPAEIAALVKKHAAGRFLFWVLVGESRLWCVDRKDGAKEVDFEVLYKVVSTAASAPTPPSPNYVSLARSGITLGIKARRTGAAVVLAILVGIGIPHGSSAQNRPGDASPLSVEEAIRKSGGDPSDFAETAYWMRKAADKGSAAAQFSLGMFYEHGLGVEKDMNQALSWYRKAADQGYNDAKEKLAELQGTAARQAAAMQLWCPEPLNDGRTMNSLVSVDASAKHVKIENSQGTLEYRHGAYAKVIIAGLLSNEAQKVHQFVTIDDNQIKWGIQNGYWVSIDRTTAIRRDAGGHVFRCSWLRSRR